MKIILDEEKAAKESIETGKIHNNIHTTIKILIRYWNSIGMNKAQIRDEIEDFLIKNYKGFNSAKWQDDLDKKVKKYTKNKKPLIKVDNIKITQNELDYIGGLENDIQERLAFTLLVYAKVGNAINPNNKNWVNANMKELFKDAKMTGNNQRKYKYIYKIKEYGGIYITKVVNSNGIRIDFLDEDSEVVIIIDDFREFVLEYEKWKGRDIGECEVCGRRIPYYNNKKYCDECQREKQLQWQRESMKKFRKRVK